MSDNTVQLLAVDNLVVEFPAAGRRTVHAVSGVSFAIARGETLGLVGESGCGKSSLARAIMQVPPPTSGRVLLDGVDLAKISGSALRQLRSSFRMVFQDPVGSLNPARSIGESLETALRAIGNGNGEVRKLAEAALDTVGLDPGQYFRRKPSGLSGGQCQRVGIARALLGQPQLLVCDEPVASLDVSIQAQIINLLRDIRTDRGLSLLFISHDLAVVQNIADRVAVMYLGRLCELATNGDFFATAAHPYSRALIAAVPHPDPWHPGGTCTLTGSDLPSAMTPPSGCRFRTRCPQAQELCRKLQPELTEIRPGHLVACHFPVSIG